MNKKAYSKLYVNLEYLLNKYFKELSSLQIDSEDSGLTGSTFDSIDVAITQTRLSNIQQYFTAEKMLIFKCKFLTFFIFLLKA